MMRRAARGRGLAAPPSGRVGPPAEGSVSASHAVSSRTTCRPGTLAITCQSALLFGLSFGCSVETYVLSMTCVCVSAGGRAPEGVHPTLHRWSRPGQRVSVDQVVWRRPPDRRWRSGGTLYQAACPVNVLLLRGLIEHSASESYRFIPSPDSLTLSAPTPPEEANPQILTRDTISSSARSRECVCVSMSV